MCGIVGFIDSRCERSADELQWAASTMADTLTHRGPDDKGSFAEPESGVAFGFRRLSIIDLSASGHQPMTSSCGRWVIAFNGEIYNFTALRRELEAEQVRFKGHSDTEVLVEYVARHGVEKAMRSADGMFALAVWDRRDKALYLARDRMGEKPLYLGWVGPVFFFASELKALRAHPGFSTAVDRGSLAAYLRLQYVPGPRSIYEGIEKLSPGTIAVVRPDEPGRAPQHIPYWSLREVATAQPRFDGRPEDAIDLLDSTLRAALRSRMVADVPLGAFLSGGVDSSTVVALMQAESSRPVKTFTIGFHEADHDEAGHARAVARHLGTEHHELYVSPTDALDVVPLLPSIYDEPFGDASQIPTILVSRTTREHVTVALSGDAGDELFGGYDRYLLHRRVWGGVQRLPLPMRRRLSRALTAVPPDRWDRLGSGVGVAASRRLGDRIHAGAGMMRSRHSATIYESMMSHWKDPEHLVPGAVEPPTLLRAPQAWPHLDPLEQLMYVDAMTYLPDDILVKVDRASMAASLECRVPLLAKDVVELAWRMPASLKMREGTGKWLLKQLLYRYVPRPIVDRPKMGFAVPIATWLRGPLRDWAEDLLDERRLRDEGFFAVAPIRAAWQAHLDGARDWHYPLWDVLMFEAWLAEQEASAAPKPLAS